MELTYPEHKHPHGVGNTAPNEFRIWVCDECEHAFADGEVRKADKAGVWGHPCHATKCKAHCESHLEPYLPDVYHIDLIIKEAG